MTHMKEKTVKQHPIRFPFDLYQRIDQMREERSFNAQVIWILKDYFRLQEKQSRHNASRHP